MNEFRLVSYTTGLLCFSLSMLMLAPAAVDAYAGNPDWRAFIASAVFTGLVGGALALGGTREGAPSEQMSTQQAFLIVVVSWVLLPFFGALPFAFGSDQIRFLDALFESVSGMTTTGATTFTSLEYLPPGVLLWRALLQWIGGLGIVLFALVFLPMLRIGGMQLFRSESLDSEGSLLVRFRDIAPTILALYVVMTSLCALFYRFFGMPGFDAVCNAMTTIATGGFATQDSSFARYSSGAQITCIVFMLAACLPFLRYVELFNLQLFRFHTDPQIRGFAAVIFAAIALVSYARMRSTPDLELGQAVLQSAFSSVSIITGSGFATTDYSDWGSQFLIFFFVMMLIGGCAGSTTCSVKIFRYQVLGLLAFGELQRMRRPSRVIILRFGGRPLSPDIAASVVTFFFLFFASLLVFTVALILTGEDLITSISGAASALANVGPGLGPKIGPVGSYRAVNDGGKIVLMLAMLLGRLELLSVFILLTPGFWRS